MNAEFDMNEEFRFYPFQLKLISSWQVLTLNNINNKIGSQCYINIKVNQKGLFWFPISEETSDFLA